MNKSVVIVGASGHGKVVADIVLKNKDNIVGFLDDNTELEESFAGFPANKIPQNREVHAYE